MKYIFKCSKCPKVFNKKSELEEHVDDHTPFWIGKKVHLSGADQIRLMLKNWSGSWSKIIKDEKKRSKRKGCSDLDKMIRLRDFEIENKLKFIVNGDKVDSFIKIEENTKEADG